MLYILTGSGSGIGAFWRFLSAILDFRANAGDCGSSQVNSLILCHVYESGSKWVVPLPMRTAAFLGGTPTGASIMRLLTGLAWNTSRRNV